MRKSQSGTTLYGDSLIPPPLPPPAEPLHPAVTAAAAAVDPVMYPTLEAGQSSQRLLVVANRLPVSAHKDREGAWQFEVSRLGLQGHKAYIRLSSARSFKSPC